jgi:hypothetical protein
VCGGAWTVVFGSPAPVNLADDPGCRRSRVLLGDNAQVACDDIYGCPEKRDGTAVPEPAWPARVGADLEEREVTVALIDGVRFLVARR